MLLLVLPFKQVAQVLPAEGSKLNYRIIGFSFPPGGTAKCKIEIASGNITRKDSFERKVFLREYVTGNNIIEEVPSFGVSYTWRINYGKKYSPLYHFSTLSSPNVNTNMLHLRLEQPAAQQYKDDYVAVDAGGVLYDMAGKPVWFIPEINGFGGNVADLKFTPQGTITFIYRSAYEIDLNGNVLWKTPDKGTISGDTIHGEFYHHEFTRLNNGHYMALATEPLWCKQVTTKDTSYILTLKMADPKAQVPNSGYKMGKFGAIVEYDEKGNIVWLWKTSKYLIGSEDFNYYRNLDSNLRFDPHDNAFYFDEAKGCIYLGFRNLNRITKIKYPEGTVLREFGNGYKPGRHLAGENFFCNQHSITRTKEGYLLVFNNNSCGLTDSLPTILLLKEPQSGSDDLQKVWEYTCTISEKHPGVFSSGGNAIELSDGSIFVNMGSQYSKLFIVDRKGTRLWSALPERFVESDNKWMPIKEYRANIISKGYFESLIWKAERQK